MNILLQSVGNSFVRNFVVSAYVENLLSQNSLGHSILTFGYNPGCDIILSPDEEFIQTLDRFPSGWWPDICLLWNTEWYLLPKGIEKAPFPIFTVEMDWDYDVPLSRIIFSCSDVVIVLSEQEKNLVEVFNHKNVILFYPQGILKRYIPDEPTPIENRPYDIFYSTGIFDDINHPQRSSWLSKLCSLSNKYNVVIRSGLSYEEYIKELSKSKLVFTYHRYGTMSCRAIEAAAQGCVVIDPGEYKPDYLKPNEEYLSITLDEASKKIPEILASPNLLNRLSTSAHRKVKLCYEAKQRFEGLLEVIEKKIPTIKPHRTFKFLDESEKHFKRGETYYYTHFRFHDLKHFFPTFNLPTLLQLSVEHFRQATALKPCSSYFDALGLAQYALHNVLAVCNNYSLAGEFHDSSINSLLTAIELDRSNPLPFLNLGIIFLEQKQLTRAKNMLKKCVEILELEDSSFNPWDLQPRFCVYFNLLVRRPLNLNLLSLLKENVPTTINLIKTIYKALALYLLGEMELEEGSLYTAYEIFLKAYQIYPDEYPNKGIICKKLSQTAMLVGAYEEALNVAKETLRHLPFDIENRILYVKLAHRNNMNEEFESIVKETRTMCTTVPHVRNWLPQLSMLEFIAKINKDLAALELDLFSENFYTQIKSAIYELLLKNPYDLKLISRLLGVYVEEGSIEKIVKLLWQCGSAFTTSKDSPLPAELKQLILRVKSELDKKLISCKKILDDLFKEHIGNEAKESS